VPPDWKYVDASPFVARPLEGFGKRAFLGYEKGLDESSYRGFRPDGDLRAHPGEGCWKFGYGVVGGAPFDLNEDRCLLVGSPLELGEFFKGSNRGAGFRAKDGRPVSRFVAKRYQVGNGPPVEKTGSEKVGTGYEG